MYINHRAAAIGAVAMLSIGLLAGCGNATVSGSMHNGSEAMSHKDGKVGVVASFYPMADFAEKIGGEHVVVTNLVPAGIEQHEWEPSPQDIAAIGESDLFVYSGAGMEGWVDDALESIDTSKMHIVEASAGIELRVTEHEHDHDGDDADEVAEHDHDADDGHSHDHDDDGDEAVEHDREHDGDGGHGHAHDHEHDGGYDPHVWLSPENARKELANIKDGLVKVDPDHKDDYEANYERYVQKFEELEQEFSTRLASAKGKAIVVSHEAYGYLCDAFGLEQMPIAGMDAEGEPDAQTMAKIIDFVRANNVTTIFSEDLVSPKVAQAIADETGAACVQLNPLEGLTEDQLDAGEDYLPLMTDK